MSKVEGITGEPKAVLAARRGRIGRAKKIEKAEFLAFIGL